MSKTLWAYNDPKSWGKQFVMAAGRLGYNAELFDRYTQVPDNQMCFVRMDQQGRERELSKRVAAKLFEKGCYCIPNAKEAVWYDDKIAQYPALKRWLPDTEIYDHYGLATSNIGNLGYPFISKSRDGSASKAVRLIHNEAQAHAEAKQAFSVQGFPSVYDRVQRGYVYWQRFIPGNETDMRIVKCGSNYFGLERKNRDDLPFASGSGKSRPIASIYDNPKAIAAFDLAHYISEELGTSWMAYDFVFDGVHPKLLELSSSWTPYSYRHCPVFKRDMTLGSPHWHRAEKDRYYGAPPYTGAYMFEMAVEHLVRIGNVATHD